MPKNEENKHINKYKLKFAQQYDKLLGFNLIEIHFGYINETLVSIIHPLTMMGEGT